MGNVHQAKGMRSEGPPHRFDQALYDRHRINRRRRQAARIRIGLLVPFSGSDAIWGPSCQYSAVLAAARINGSGGILGREIELFAADAGGAPDAVVARVRNLLAKHEVNALVGVHLSNVRDAICQAMAGSVPYIFAPQYEGGARGAGLVAIGETPAQQYSGAVRWMIAQKQARRWYLLGNDYVWPRGTHAILKKLIHDAGGTVIAEDYLPLATQGHQRSLQNITDARPDIVFESLVGSDSVTFNKAFGAAGLAQNIIRLSGAIEENTLMGISPEYADNLYCVSGYFHSLQTRENADFLKEYRQAFGDAAPIQGAISQSCYESLFALQALAQKAGSFDIQAITSAAEDFCYHAARGPVHIRNSQAAMTNYLMRSDGLDYSLVQSFPAA